MRRSTGCAVAAALAAASALMYPVPQAAAQQPDDNRLRGARDGVTVNTPAAFQGYTLVAPMGSTSTYLIDMEGRIVNEWKSDCAPALGAYLLENGHLLRPGSEPGFDRGGAGAGGRIQEFTWEGELVWDYSFGDSRLRPHHDICPLPNGNVLVIASDPKTKNEAVAAGRWPDSAPSRLMSECILEIKPTGKTTSEIVWRWNAWDHLIQDCDESKPNFGEVSEHPELIDVNFGSGMVDRMMQDPEQLRRLRALGYVGGDDDEPSEDQRGGPGGPMQGDWLHMNYVAYNAELDQIMLSVHEYSEAWVIDHSTTAAQAASHKGGRSGRGGDLLYRWGNPRAYRAGSDADQRLFAQHCAHWIENGRPGAGNMLVFNNGGGRPDGSYSSVDEIEIPVDARGIYNKEQDSAFSPKQAAWSYTAPEKSDLFSMVVSGAQRLPNGNTLICSGTQALLLEVTPNGEIVWQYKHPGGDSGGSGDMPRPGELVPEIVQQMLGVTNSQKQSIDKLQSDVDEKLALLLTDEQRQKMNQPTGPPFGGPRGARRGGFQPSRVGSVIPESLVEDLALSEAQRNELKQIQQRVDNQLGKIWTERQKTQLKRIEELFTRGPGSGPPPGFGPPGGFGPGGGDGPEGGGPRAGRRSRGGPVGRPGRPGARGGPDGPGGPGRPGGPGGPGGPGRPGGPGGPGGIFCTYRYAADFPGLAGRELKPQKKLAEVAEPTQPPRERPRDEEH